MRPLAPWRLLLRALGRIALALAWVVLPLLLLAPALGRLVDAPAWRALANLLTVGLTLGCYAAYVRWGEKRRPHELALRGAAREWGAGLLLGASLFALVLALLAAAGAVRVTAGHGWSVIPAIIPGMLAGALFEEVMFRAIILRLLEDAIGSWRALAVSALVFGAMHFGNPGAGLVGALAVGLEAGVLLGAAFMLTRRLWLCTAIHLAWNVLQGGVLSMAVSGASRHGVFLAVPAGPAWLTGGAFGPEASLVAVLLCSACAALMLRRCASIGRIVAPAWRRSGSHSMAGSMDTLFPKGTTGL